FCSRRHRHLHSFPTRRSSDLCLEWQHMSGYYMDAANTEKYEGFNVFNLRLGYERKRLDTWINVLNITDKLYATNASKSRFGKSYSPGDPRTVSIGLAIKLLKNDKTSHEN